VAFTKEEILQKFQKLIILDHKQITQLSDYPDIEESSQSTENLYPFNPFIRDTIPDSILNNFDEFWTGISQILDSILRDLYSQDPIENLELVQI
jgi:hypothetical protein